MMENTTQPAARMLATLLVNHGVCDVVTCPGTRNAPLVVAVSRHPQLKVTTVIDERSAAFIGLGMAIRTGRPTAIVCTSGSAMLNFAPAVAEACYRGIPLIAVTADRPAAWIDQKDSQTIRQGGALDNIVRASTDIAADLSTDQALWHANRAINDVLLAATGPTPGPVHINVQLDTPLGNTAGFDDKAIFTRTIQRFAPERRLATDTIRSFACELADKKVLVAVGFMPPSSRMSRALAKMNSLPNVIVFREAQSNLFGLHEAVDSVDATITSLSDDERCTMLPDVVITVGGSLLSSSLKKWLRSATHLSHWDVGCGSTELSADVFLSLDRRIEADAAPFLSALAGSLSRIAPKSDYHRFWADRQRRVNDFTAQFTSRLQWCDMKATAMFVDKMPDRWNLHVSNGMSVRYLQLTSYTHLHRVDCNRGVSGIDGSTSTAIGASIGCALPTVLLTGDMSAQYDIGALAANCIPSNFRIAVLNNSGGDIFRFISATRHLDECQERLAFDTRLDLDKLAAAFGFQYLCADSIDSMNKAMTEFVRDSGRPVLIDIRTGNVDNAGILREFYKKIKTIE